jgi:hypothetical protein
MIGSEVIVNDTKVCVAGIGAPGDLQISAVWALRHSQDDLTGTPGTSDESIGLWVGGKAYADAEHLTWPYTHLQVGDEIVLRVVDRESFDPPAARGVIDREQVERDQRALYERLKRKYGPGLFAEPLRTTIRQFLLAPRRFLCCLG